MEHYTLIGTTMPSFFQWAFGVVAVMGLIWSLSPRRRWMSIGISFASLLILTVHIPAPYALAVFVGGQQVGAILDTWLQANQKKLQLALKICGMVAYLSLFPLCFLMIPTHKDLQISRSHLSFTNDRWGTKRVDSSQIDLIGLQDSGKVIEWEASTKAPGTKEAFIGNILESELYWDHNGHVLTGPELGRRLADLTGAKPRFMPISRYYDDQQTRVSTNK